MVERKKIKWKGYEITDEMTPKEKENEQKAGGLKESEEQI